MSARNRFSSCLPYLLGGLLLGITQAHAEPKTGAGDSAIKKVQGMIRQLSQQKMTLEAEKSVWLNEKAELEGKVAHLEAQVTELKSLQGEVERYKSSLKTITDNLESQLGQERQTRLALLEKHNGVVAKARDIQADNQLLVQAVQERETWITRCATLNKELQSANQEILNQYRDKGLLQQVLELEPFTGIAQIQSETVAENYRYKLQQLKITPFQSSGVTAVDGGNAPENQQEGR